MELLGNVKKMESAQGKPIQYSLPLGEERIQMNALVGKEISLEYLGEINCMKCGRLTTKSFAQGYCFPCFRTAPETEECVLRPELCRAHEGEARDLEYAGKHCLIEHVVYLSHTSGIKVGVTRNTQVPTRWIDQGAVSVIELARTPNRHLAGMIEVSLKAHMNDKTNWRIMLSDVDPEAVDLKAAKERALSLLPRELGAYGQSNNSIVRLEYPVIQYPQKIRSHNLDKDARLTGKLSGIKGQYLIFSDNSVINIRKYGGYRIKLQTD